MRIKITRWQRRFLLSEEISMVKNLEIVKKND
jgi:hypothetical protein